PRCASRSRRRPRRARRAGPFRGGCRRSSGSTSARASAAISPFRCRGLTRPRPERPTHPPSPAVLSGAIRGPPSSHLQAILGSVRRLLLPLAAFFALAPAAHAGGPTLNIGAAEDAVRADTLGAAKAKLDQLKLAGFTAVRVSETWKTGQTSPDANE